MSYESGGGRGLCERGGVGVLMTEPDRLLSATHLRRTLNHNLCPERNFEHQSIYVHYISSIESVTEL